MNDWSSENGARARPALWVVAALAMTASACLGWPGDTIHHVRGPSPVASRAADEAAEAGLGDDEMTSDMAALGDEPPDLSGTWAQMQITSTLTNPPMMGEMRSTTTTLLRIEVRQEGLEYRATARVCDLDVASEGGMSTIVPEAFVEAIPVAELRGSVAPFDGGYRIVQGASTQVLGAELDDPATDALPRRAADERVIDQDGDGHPGVTIRVEGFAGGDIYIVQRTVRALEGVIRDLETVNGTIDWSMEQVTLGASSFMLNIDTQARADARPERNVFRSRRVEPGSSCADLERDRDRLFSR